MKEVIIYTDGSSLGNPGPGGYGIILSYKGIEKEMSGGDVETTNNKMELTAVIKALKQLKEPCKATVYSDSKYVIDSVTKGWVYTWRKNNWMRNKKDPALNVELWEDLLELLEIHDVTFVWVKGHSDNEKNARCDKLATDFAKSLKKS